MTEFEFFLLSLLVSSVAVGPLAGHAIGYAKGKRAARSLDYRDGYSDGYRTGVEDAVGVKRERELTHDGPITRPGEVVPVSVDGDEGEPWPPKRAVDVRRPE